jgi:hypothetical protein
MKEQEKRPAHTPGPWHAVFDKLPSPFYVGLVALVEGSGRDGNAAVVTNDRECPKEEWHANARLIAAAPELLKALCDLAEMHEGRCDSCGCRIAQEPDEIEQMSAFCGCAPLKDAVEHTRRCFARAAIAKAEGRPA